MQHAGGAKIDLDAVLLPMALCADARLDGEALIGDPTEGALIVLAEKGGISVEGAREMYPRIAEVPFDSDYKFMATFHNMKNEQGKPVVRCFVKGAPDVLIARAGSYWLPGGEVQPITDDNLPLALQENERMAKEGERVMVVARRDFDPATFDPKGKLLDLVNDLTLLAMVGIVDPPRAEAKDAIARCHSAGIQVRMITGDHAVTAAAIGHELGIEGRALTGAQFAAIPDEQLKQQLDQIGVVARVAPEDKIRLVTLLQQKENIVAMTGDGVNDAPALKKADIGVAMGITGTEVSKEAAVMILTDDNFATIVKAVEYGRHIYNNLFNFVRFQMDTAGGVHCFLPAGRAVPCTGRHAVHATSRPVSQLPHHGPGGSRAGVRQTGLGSDGEKAPTAEATHLVPVTMGAHRLHRDPDGDRHSLSGGDLQCGHHRLCCLFSPQHRHGPQRTQRDSHRIQSGHFARSKPTVPLWPGFAGDRPGDRARFPAAHPGPDSTERKTVADLSRHRYRLAARRRGHQSLPAQPPKCQPRISGNI